MQFASVHCALCTHVTWWHEYERRAIILFRARKLSAQNHILISLVCIADTWLLTCLIWNEDQWFESEWEEFRRIRPISFTGKEYKNKFRCFGHHAFASHYFSFLYFSFRKEIFCKFNGNVRLKYWHNYALNTYLKSYLNEDLR